MPEWNFFAFDSVAVAKSMLTPAQEAVRNRDLPAWQKIFDLLNGTPVRPLVSSLIGYHILPYSLVTGPVAPQNVISRDVIPDESHVGLRKTLQTFVEQASPLFVTSKRTKIRIRVTSLIHWDEVLTSQEELDEMRLFQETIIPRSKKLPDPFWCLASGEVVDANYADPATVARMAEVESSVGLFRRLVRRTDLADHAGEIGPELATAGLTIELAATRGYGLYFRGSLLVFSGSLPEKECRSAAAILEKSRNPTLQERDPTGG